jgi:hypothetical protein
MSKRKHPMQRLYRDDEGTVRFRVNPIVRHLLDFGGYDLNKLAAMGFDHEDWQQFMQLIGYSVSGYMDLNCSQEHAERKRVEKGEKKLLRKEKRDKRKSPS